MILDFSNPLFYEALELAPADLMLHDFRARIQDRADHALHSSTVFFCREAYIARTFAATLTHQLQGVRDSHAKARSRLHKRNNCSCQKHLEHDSTRSVCRCMSFRDAFPQPVINKLNLLKCTCIPALNPNCCSAHSRLYRSRW